MAEITVEAGREIGASPERVYRAIADYATQHARWLPANYLDYTVEQGGMGEGTVYRYTLKVGNRQRVYHLAVSEVQPGAVLTERDTGSTLVNTWTVSPHGDGSRVSLLTRWDGHGGIGGFFERLFAPGALKRVYDDELGRLDAYTTGTAG